MIDAENLTKDFNDFRAVDNVTLKVEPGTVFAILGPNGAGKTTTVRMLTSILKPTAGRAKVAGYDVVTQAEYVRASVGVLTEQHGLYERMRATEYLDFFGRIYNLDAGERKRRAVQLMERFGLGEAINRRIGEYSKGMKQKLSLVRSMLHNPQVLLLDEPTSAMDPQSTKLVRDAMLELKRDRRTIVLTTHNLNEAFQLADTIGVFRRGRLIANGTFAELSQRFVGNPLIELKVKGAIEPALAVLAEGNLITVQERGPDWLHYRTADPASINPQVLYRLTAAKIDVITLSEIQESLEAVYLQIVAEDEGIDQSREQALTPEPAGQEKVQGKSA
jgi:ABC-2 type transport system ATP-binding protein